MQDDAFSDVDAFEEPIFDDEHMQGVTDAIEINRDRRPSADIPVLWEVGLRGEQEEREGEPYRISQQELEELEELKKVEDRIAEAYTDPLRSPRRVATGAHDARPSMRYDEPVLYVQRAKVRAAWHAWQGLPPERRATTWDAPLLDGAGRFTWLGVLARDYLLPALAWPQPYETYLLDQRRLAPRGLVFDTYSAAVLGALEDDAQRVAMAMTELNHADPTIVDSAEQDFEWFGDRIVRGLRLLPDLIACCLETPTIDAQ